MGAQDDKIALVQLLRGVAATMVACYHLYAAAVANSPGYDGAFALFRHGEAGVDVFFVISGFIIYYASARKPGLTPRAFAVARFHRIYPSYWAVLTTYLALSLGLAALAGDASDLPDARRLAVSVLLLPYPDHALIVAWTLTIELLFYALFCLTYFRFGAQGFLIALAVWAVAAQVHTQAFETYSRYLVYPLHSMVVEFLAGALIAHVRLRRALPFGPAALVAGAASLVAYLLGAFEGVPLGREATAGLPATLIVYGAVATPTQLPAFVLLWGEASYLLYLSHIMIFAVIGRLAGAGGVLVYGDAGAMALMLVAAVAASMVGVILFERPYQRWVRSRAH